MLARLALGVAIALPLGLSACGGPDYAARQSQCEERGGAVVSIVVQDNPPETETWCDMPPFIGAPAAYPYQLSAGDTLIAPCSRMDMFMADRGRGDYCP